MTTPYGLSNGDGILTTSAGLLFEGAPNGVLSARNPVNGKVLWSWQTGTGIATTPVTYTVNGVQYVAILAGGNTSYNSVGDSLWAFKLHGTVPPAKAPAPIPARVPIGGPTIAGGTVGDTVVMGRTWDSHDQLAERGREPRQQGRDGSVDHDRASRDNGDVHESVRQ